ncbi:MAG: hypothetical protein U5J83_09210 [Bryobacterales bacterium]|nr:hypothetical protein [Bryobacterales bacterium]
MSDEALALLQKYDWPGNVRELRNAIERAMILEDGACISADTLPISIVRSDTTQSIFLDPQRSSSSASASATYPAGNGGLALRKQKR